MLSGLLELFQHVTVKLLTWNSPYSLKYTSLNELFLIQKVQFLHGFNILPDRALESCHNNTKQSSIN